MLQNYYTMQGCNERGQEGSNSPGAETLWGRRMTAGGAENSQQCHKYFLQNSKFAFIRPLIQAWGRLGPGAI